MSSRFTPASSAAWMVAIDSASSAGPYMPDIPMQPRASGNVRSPEAPSERCGMVVVVMAQG
ncbi:MAG: hypothetical protein QM767_19090 [Anaeromyxobacter sp.]